MSIYCKTFLVNIFVLFSFWASAQQFLQLEITNSLSTKKFAVGDVLIYKTTEFPKDWQKARITGIDYETNIVRFERKVEFVTDITHVKIIKQVPYVLSRMLYAFAGVSALYGGIGDAFQGELQSQTIIFPLSSLALALVLDKVITVKVYPIGKRAKLRVLDLRI